MMIVNQVLQTKGNQVWSIHPDATVYEALQLMADKNIGAVLVLADEGIAGIFSERDYARKVILHGKASQETAVSEVMTDEVVCVHPDLSLDKCLALMTNKRVRHLPVLNDEEDLMGIVSIGDVVKAKISEQQVIIDHLQDYIMGKV